MRLKPNDTKQNLAGKKLAPAKQCIQTMPGQPALLYPYLLIK